MDQKDWALLQALGKYHSITQASEAMFVSQPALSKRLRLLEQEFNIQLVTRTSTGIQLTPAGEYLVTYADEMLQKLREVQEHLSALQEDRSVLRIGIPNMFSQWIMPDIWRAFSALYPSISPYTRSGFSSDIVQWLKNKEIQLAFLRGSFRCPGYLSYIISADPICLISRHPIEIDQLPQFPRIIYNTDPLLQRQLNRWWNQRLAGQKMQVGMEVGDSQTCVHFVEQGIGYALVPLYVLNPGTRNQLWINPLSTTSGKAILRATSLVYPSVLPSQAASCFVNFIQERFPPISLNAATLF